MMNPTSPSQHLIPKVKFHFASLKKTEYLGWFSSCLSLHSLNCLNEDALSGSGKQHRQRLSISISFSHAPCMDIIEAHSVFILILHFIFCTRSLEFCQAVYLEWSVFSLHISPSPNSSRATTHILLVFVKRAVFIFFSLRI